jgi:hypothetical protein
MSAPASRPVHPCVLEHFQIRGAEFSCWARIRTMGRQRREKKKLITACSNSLAIYELRDQSTVLDLVHRFDGLYGSIVSLNVIHGNLEQDEDDALLLGFAGHPRLAVVTVQQEDASIVDGFRGCSQGWILQAQVLLDLTPAISELAVGAVTPLEQDIMVSVNQKSHTQATFGVVLGGGVGVAVAHIERHGTSWHAEEPYLIPLSTLENPYQKHGDNSNTISASAAATAALGSTAVATGFGDILDIAQIECYLEPVLLLLHTGPGGKTFEGRLVHAPPHYLTALSVSIHHARTAILWTQVVPNDSFRIDSYAGSKNHPNDTIVVVGVNTLSFITAAGTWTQCLAVNGWATSGCPPIDPTPNPGIPLAISLDGSRLCWVAPDVAILSLRHGELYVLQKHRDQSELWSLWPTGQTLGGMGEIANLGAIPMQEVEEVDPNSKNFLSWSEMEKGEKNLAMGLLFAGSRLGNSLLFGFVLETVTMAWDTVAKLKKVGTIKEEENNVNDITLLEVNHINDETDDILRIEEEALYAPADATNNGPHIVPPLSDEETSLPSQKKRARREEVSVRCAMLRVLKPLDVLVNLGPLGPSCEGPVSKPPPYLVEAEQQRAMSLGVLPQPVFGASAHIFPCGYGSSGGIALVTVPGRDDRVILAEGDCLNATCIFSLPSFDMILVGMVTKNDWGIVDSIKAIKLIEHMQEEGDKNKKTEHELSELDLEDWCPGACELFQSETKLLSAGEFPGGNDVIFVIQKEDAGVLLIVASRDDNNKISRPKVLSLPGDNSGSQLVSLSHQVAHSRIYVSFCCLWSNGNASLVSVSRDGKIDVSVFQTIPIDENIDSLDLDGENDDHEAREFQAFYTSSNIVAADVFKAPLNMFPGLETPSEVDVNVHSVDGPLNGPGLPVDTKIDPSQTVHAIDWSKTTVKTLRDELHKRGLRVAGKKADLVAAMEESDRCQMTSERSNSQQVELLPTEAPKDAESDAPITIRPTVSAWSTLDFDDDDKELYATNKETKKTRSGVSSTKSGMCIERSRDEGLFVAICRQSGVLEIYNASNGTNDLRLCWKTPSASLGIPVMKHEHASKSTIRRPRSHKVAVKEMCFFSCGSTYPVDNDEPSTQIIYFAIETSKGDLLLYELDERLPFAVPIFRRVPLRTVSRPSKEQSRHKAKLTRKGALGKTDTRFFRYNQLHRFSGLSAQDGLFVAGPRPLWFVLERGQLASLHHRTRHAAPAGGKDQSVCGICFGVKGGYITIHERVGRVGSQRMTLFRGLSPVFDTNSILPGSGLCVEKISFGVTVRRIQFIEDESSSSGEHPLYAVLVSRELEIDQSELNTDGLTDEERKRIEAEKEAVKIQRQVEADLGGFDLESEWVEEIERENIFKIDMGLGGAPPVHKSIFSLWIVDAANKWNVVDSFEFEEHERLIDLQVMSLTEFKEEPASSTAPSADEAGPKSLFIAMGTGYVGVNGEDVTTKGRLLLLSIRRPDESLSTGAPVAELSLVCEKNIFHGPVTSLSCLSSEGRNRLVVGAGSDVNIEQWGSNGRLTQVGFFRATMHISDITHFKNFLLLSDACDSLHFLVWRESDKSLTLLAKDYDPISVYAAGIMTRGAVLTFLCHDDRQNLQFFQYAPGEAAARGGNKLVCRADFHLGSQTTAFQTYFCRPSLIAHTATLSSTIAALKQQEPLFGRQDDDQRLGAYFGTTDGGLGSTVPLSEPNYWRLMALQSVMANALQDDCSLSQRAWRLYRRTPRRGGCRYSDRKKSVIDGGLVLKYADLASPEQEDLASAIGSSVDLILDNLLEAQCGGSIL